MVKKLIILTLLFTTSCSVESIDIQKEYEETKEVESGLKNNIHFILTDIQNNTELYEISKAKFWINEVRKNKKELKKAEHKLDSVQSVLKLQREILNTN